MKRKIPFLIIAVAVILFIIFEAFFHVSSSAVKVLDARVSFKFTAYQDKEQYFISHTLENLKQHKVKAVAQVQLGESSLGQRLFHAVQTKEETLILDSLETKVFVTQIDVPKAKNAQESNLAPHVKIKRVSRA